jgi:hypothetical protein
LRSVLHHIIELQHLPNRIWVVHFACAANRKAKKASSLHKMQMLARRRLRRGAAGEVRRGNSGELLSWSGGPAVESGLRSQAGPGRRRQDPRRLQLLHRCEPAKEQRHGGRAQVSNGDPPQDSTSSGDFSSSGGPGTLRTTGALAVTGHRELGTPARAPTRSPPPPATATAAWPR